jgi:putative hemolysin
MKLILILTFFSITELTLASNASRCINDPKNPKLKCSKRTPVKRSQQELMALKNKPKLKNNQFSLAFENNKTIVFSTQIYNGLVLSQNCFKGNTPICQAYKKSIQALNTKPEENMKSPYHNNFGAIHCELMGGKGLIAKTSTNDESDFCKFEDGSMVSSWSAYYKTHPRNQTK